MGCGAGRRCSLDPALLWLWCRLAAVALIRPLAWEPPHAEGSGPRKRQKDEKRRVSLRNYHKKLPSKCWVTADSCYSCLEGFLNILFFSLYGHTWGIRKFLGWRVKQSCSYQPTPQPQQHGIRATSATYASGCGNAGSLTHWARPEVEPSSSRTLCWVLNPPSHNRHSLSVAFCLISKYCFLYLGCPLA